MKGFPDLDAFVSYLRVERSVSENTITMYSADLRNAGTSVLVAHRGRRKLTREPASRSIRQQQRS